MSGSKEALGAAEQMALLDPERVDAPEAISMVLIEMALRGAIRIVDSGAAPDLFLSVLDERLVVWDHARDVLRVLRFAAADGAVTLRDFAMGANRRWGSGLRDFVASGLLPDLVGRGLLREESSKRFFGLGATRFVHTPEGEAEKRETEARLARAVALPMLLGSSPAGAPEILRAVGSTLLLAPGLHRHFPALARMQSGLRPGDLDLGRVRPETIGRLRIALDANFTAAERARNANADF